MPLWLTKILDDGHIYKSSFSKYGEAYKRVFSEALDHENDLSLIGNDAKGTVNNCA